MQIVTSCRVKLAHVSETWSNQPKRYDSKHILILKSLNFPLYLAFVKKIETKTLLAYGVYQIEADGLELFEYVKGDKDSIMGLPIKEIINYIKQL